MAANFTSKDLRNIPHKNRKQKQWHFLIPKTSKLKANILRGSIALSDATLIKWDFDSIKPMPYSCPEQQVWKSRKTEADQKSPSTAFDNHLKSTV